MSAGPGRWHRSGARGSCAFLRAAANRCAAPSSRISPPADAPPEASISPMIAAAGQRFCLRPDSPTTPRTSPGAIENETSSTANQACRRRVGNSTRRWLTSSSGTLEGTAAADTMGCGPTRSTRSKRSRRRVVQLKKVVANGMSAQLRVQRIAQPVAEQVHRQHHRHQRGRPETPSPTIRPEKQEAVADADQTCPATASFGGHTDAEETIASPR